ncbi:MAG: TylF/MycF/NovP-related O-methyltransferase [Pseudobdellovibrionaceae bacterium]
MKETSQDLKSSLNTLIDEISEKHRMHRKAQFLLDIRGLLVINKLEGCYAEFGVYRGEMMYAAAKVLGQRITKYLGFDTFEGLPEPEKNDESIFVFEQVGFMKAPEDFVKDMMSGYPHALVKGDFRQPQVQEEIHKSVGKDCISVLSLDCNWPSSVEASLDVSAPHLVSGSIVYFDDYYVGTRAGDYMKPIMEAFEKKHGMRFVDFKVYAPCARAFLIEKK